MPHLARAQSGSILTTDDMVERASFRESEYFREFLQPQGVFLGASAVAFGARDGFADVAVMWPLERDRIDAEHVRFLEQLLPHVQTALRVQRRMKEVTGQRDLAMGALEWFPQGVLWLDHRGRVVQTNDRAARILARADPLTCDRAKHLRLQRPGDRAAFDALCQRTVRHGDDALAGSGGAMRVEREDGRVHELIVSPIAEADGEGRFAAIVFVTDPDGDSLQPARLAELYGLTRTEAEVARDLVDGLTVKEVAARRDVTVTTVRGHVRSLLHKTETERQSELIRRIVEGVARLGTDSS